MTESPGLGELGILPGMRRGMAGSWVLLLCGCQRLNPAFDAEAEFGTELADEADTAATTDSTNTTNTTDATETETSVSSTEDTGPSETETTDPSTTDTDTDTGPDPCDEGQLLCDGVCVDTSSDPFNCGGCGAECSDGLVCVASICAHPKRVFVTSIPFQAGDGGVDAADSFCNLLASSAGLDGTFKAWLSTPNSSPATSFTQSNAYARTDGALIATSWADLIDGAHPVPIDVDEYGGPLPGVPGCGVGSGAWSATTPTGQFAGAPNCANWTVATINESGKMGDVLAMDAKWSDVGNCAVPCSTPLPIYCFEQ